MKEASLWNYIKKGLAGRGLLNRIESSVGNGIPDVLFCIPQKFLWIELKYVKEWPKRNTTKVKLPLRPEQVIWINSRGNLSGLVFVLIKIENDFFLIKHNEINELYANGSTKDEWINLFKNRQRYWSRRIDFSQLMEMFY